MKNKTLFISGSGRSGTNITKAILGAHSQVGTLPFEYRFSLDPDGVFDFYNAYPTSWSPFIASKKIKRFINFLNNLSSRDQQRFEKSKEILNKHNKGLDLTPYPYHGWELNKAFPGYEKFVQELQQKLVEFSYPAVWPGADALQKKHHMHFAKPLQKKELQPILSHFLSQCVQAFLEKEQKSTFVEDNTWSILFADDVLDLFPNGKILHIMRDPRDVIASMVKQRWTPTNVKEATIYYKTILNQWFQKRKKIDTNKVLEIRLEDLTGNPKKVISSICDFAEIPFESNLLNIDLSKSNSGRYKSQFSTHEIAFIEDTTKEIFDTYNYT